MARKRGPLKIMEVNGSDYALQDRIIKEIEHVHISRILPFYYDPIYYDFNISHVAEITNVVDSFSRLLSDTEMDCLNDIPKICIMTGEQLSPDKYGITRSVHSVLVGHRRIEPTKTVQYLKL